MLSEPWLANTLTEDCWGPPRDPNLRIISVYEALRDIDALRICKVAFEPYPRTVSITEPVKPGR